MTSHALHRSWNGINDGWGESAPYGLSSAGGSVRWIR